MMQEKILTVAIPLFNEEEVLPDLLLELSSALTNIRNYQVNVLFVDDGSTDQTLQYLKSLKSVDFKVDYISLSRNFGHQAAISAIMDTVETDLLVIMDGDLQDPPSLIPEMLKKYDEGYDLIYTYRNKRDGGIFKKICYFSFYRIFSSLSKVEVQLDSGDFVLISRQVLLELRRIKEYHKFHRALRSWIGFKQAGVGYDRPERLQGKPKYTFKKLFALAFEGLFSFSLVPLRVGYLVGFVAVLLSFTFLIYSLIAYIGNKEVPSGFTSTITLITFTFGIIMCFLGILGEYIGRVYEQSKDRPQYIIREKSLS